MEGDERHGPCDGALGYWPFDNCQEEDHVLPEGPWLNVHGLTETAESKTVDDYCILLPDLEASETIN